MGRNGIIFFILFILFGVVGCRSRKVLTQNKTETTSSGSRISAEFSKKLGIPVPESANPELMRAVSDWMGVPYKFGGNDRKGLDCSGFINRVFPEVYQIQVPRVAADIYAGAKPVSQKHLQEGDLVFFKINTSKVGHVGIFLFDQYFAHASTSKGVMISRLDQPYWVKYFAGAGRIKN